MTCSELFLCKPTEAGKVTQLLSSVFKRNGTCLDIDHFQFPVHAVAFLAALEKLRQRDTVEI